MFYVLIHSEVPKCLIIQIYMLENDWYIKYSWQKNPHKMKTIRELSFHSTCPQKVINNSRIITINIIVLKVGNPKNLFLKA